VGPLHRWHLRRLPPQLEHSRSNLTSLTIDWSHGPLAIDLGTVILGADINIAWDTSGNPDDLSLSVLLERGDPDTEPTVVSVPAYQRRSKQWFFSLERREHTFAGR